MAGAFSKYLQPRIKQPMARDKAIAVNEAIKDARLIKTRKKLRRLEDEANAQPVLAPSQPFDRQAFASFCNDWDTEIQTLSEDEQDRLYKQIEPFFAGKILGMNGAPSSICSEQSEPRPARHPIPSVRINTHTVTGEVSMASRRRRRRASKP